MTNYLLASLRRERTFCFVRRCVLAFVVGTAALLASRALLRQGVPLIDRCVVVGTYGAAVVVLSEGLRGKST